MYRSGSCSSIFLFGRMGITKSARFLSIISDNESKSTWEITLCDTSTRGLQCWLTSPRSLYHRCLAFRTGSLMHLLVISKHLRRRDIGSYFLDGGTEDKTHVTRASHLSTSTQISSTMNASDCPFHFSIKPDTNLQRAEKFQHRGTMKKDGGRKGGKSILRVQPPLGCST